MLDALLTTFPNADLYTFYHNTHTASLKKYSAALRGTSWIQYLPYIYKLGNYFSIFKVISWFYFLTLNVDAYDIIISSTHSYGAKMVRKNPNAYHICYVHTTPRYLYGEAHELRFIHRFPFTIILFPFLYILKRIDIWSSIFPDLLLANSINTQKKIECWYARKSVLVYPPVIVKTARIKSKHFFITQARLVKQKGLLFLVRMCAKYKLPLLVVGSGYYMSALKNVASKYILFPGFVSEYQLAQLYSLSYALLYNASSDDFGLVPAEALARGVPVICNMTGGVAETIIEGENGVSFTENDEKSFLRAIVQLFKTKISAVACQTSVENLTLLQFSAKIREYINKRTKI